ncbi:MAG: zinc ribbon domain-containing protein [Candidatus Hermodarchaeota archaeon]
MSHHNLKRKTAISIWILIILCILIFSIIGSLYITWFWIIFLPLSFLLVVAFQAMSEHFWTPKKVCPRCNFPISVYSEYCRNCGLQLIKKCPDCGNYIKTDKLLCDKCGHKFIVSEEFNKPIEYQTIQKGVPLPVIANFCPNCGHKLKDEDKTSEICPLCGGKIE